MDESRLIQGGQRMIPVLEILLRHAEAGSIERMCDYRTSHVSPLIKELFNDTDSVDVETDSLEHLHWLVNRAVNGCANALTFQDTPDYKKIFDLGIEQARSSIDRIKK